ncbi:hypothetical protein [uncultured Fibrella sp.]|uniref:hypothetical protein n=1 Tax=uncultured Fibrella sp. TaxID=1284596 RepID=UPI0035CC6FEB
MSFTQHRQPIQPIVPDPAATGRPSVWPGWLYALVFTALPIGAVSWAWANLAVNVPKWDDHALKGFLIALEHETSPLGWFRQVVKQHNEHRIAYDRLLTWADYTLFGKLSFKRLMIYGDLSLLALVVLFGAFLRRYVRPWYLFLPPVALFIVSLAQWENLYWALSSIQNFSIVGWSIACLYLLAHHHRIGWAITLAMIATLVSGNGFLVWPIGLVLLLAQHRTKELIPWCVAAVLLIALYFGDYVQPTTHPQTRGSLLELAGGCLAFLGAAVEALPTNKPYPFSIVLGGGLLACWGVIFLQALARSRQKIAWTPLQAFGLGALAFLLGTAVVVVWGRYGYGHDMLLTSRYRIYSLTLLALTYTYCISAYYQTYAVPFRSGWFLALIGLAVGGIFWWSAFRFNAHESIALRRMLLTNMQYNWTYTTNSPLSTIDDTTRRLIDNAPAFYDAQVPAFFIGTQAPPVPVDTLFKRNNAYVIRLSAQVAGGDVPSLTRPDAGLNVLLRSAKRTYLYGALPAPRRHWRVLVNLLPLYATDQPIELVIPDNELEVGTYQVAIVHYKANQPAGIIQPTSQLLTVSPHRLATGPAKNW